MDAERKKLCSRDRDRYLGFVYCVCPRREGVSFSPELLPLSLWDLISGVYLLQIEQFACRVQVRDR